MKKVALLPNLFTLGNMVCGVSAMLYAYAAFLSQDAELFKRACWLVMLAILLDGLDGKIAVLTRSCTQFGVQFDSMADLVSFGVAPAFLMTSYIQIQSGGTPLLYRICWALMVIQIGCVALRLARFNLQVYKDEKQSFQGLPSPMSAAFAALLLLSAYEYGLPLHPVSLLMAVVATGGLMVSHIPYPSLKKSDFIATQPLPTFFLVVLVFALLLMEPVGPLLLGVTAYILFGMARQFAPANLADRVMRWRESRKETPSKT